MGKEEKVRKKENLVGDEGGITRGRKSKEGEGGNNNNMCASKLLPLLCVKPLFSIISISLIKTNKNKKQINL